MLAYRSWASLHLGALAEERVGLVEQEHALLRQPRRRRAQVLLGLADVLARPRPTGRSGTGPAPGRAAMTSAAMVLPVPDGPEKSALTPLRPEAIRPQPPGVEHAVARAHRIGQLAQAPNCRLGQHEIVPRDCGIDALGDRIEVGPARLARRLQTGRPHLPCPRRDAGGGGPDLRATQSEQARDLGHRQRRGCDAGGRQLAPPQPRPLGGGGTPDPHVGTSRQAAEELAAELREQVTAIRARAKRLVADIAAEARRRAEAVVAELLRGGSIREAREAIRQVAQRPTRGWPSCRARTWSRRAMWLLSTWSQDSASSCATSARPARWCRARPRRGWSRSSSAWGRRAFPWRL